MATLGFNIDHVATVRQARRGLEPDPVTAALVAELHGITCVTFHLREDRRHIQDRDAFTLREVVQTKLNMEMAATEEMTRIALDLRPNQATLVPENREEITTEGGLDVVSNRAAVSRAIEHLHGAGIEVSLFVDPDEQQIALSKEVGADAIELHTGTYANAHGEGQGSELERLRRGAVQAHGLGLTVHAGHGLTLGNVRPVAHLPQMCELNIGHSIVSRAVFVGLERAIIDMVEAIRT